MEISEPQICKPWFSLVSSIALTTCEKYGSSPTNQPGIGAHGPDHPWSISDMVPAWIYCGKTTQCQKPSPK